MLRLFAEKLDFFHIGSNDSGDGLRICCLPGGKVQTALGDVLANFQKNEGNILGEQCADLFSQAFAALQRATVDVHGEGRVRCALDNLNCTAEAEFAYLVSAAAGRTAGNINLRQRITGSILRSHFFKTACQQALRIAHAHLADGGTDAGHAACEGVIGCVRRERHYLCCLGSSEVDNIYALVGCKTQLGGFNVLQIIRQSEEAFDFGQACLRMIIYGVKTGLLLRGNTEAGDELKVTLGDFRCFRL